MQQKQFFMIFLCFFSVLCFAQDAGTVFFETRTNDSKVAYEHYIENLLHKNYENENDFFSAYSEYIFYKHFAQSLDVSLKNFETITTQFYKQAEKFSKQELLLIERFFSWLTKDSLVQTYVHPLVLELEEPLVETAMVETAFEDNLVWYKFIALTQAETLYERLTTRLDTEIPLEQQLSEKSVTLSDSAFAALINNPCLLAVVLGNNEFEPLVLLLKNTLNALLKDSHRDSFFISSDFFAYKDFLFPKNFYEQCYSLLPEKFTQEEVAHLYQTDSLVARVTNLAILEGVDITQILPSSLATFYQQILEEPLYLALASRDKLENFSKNLNLLAYLIENYGHRINELLKHQSVLKKN